MAAVVGCLVYAAYPAGAPAAPAPTREETLLGKSDFIQNLGRQVPGDLDFRDEEGGRVSFSEFYGDRPIILVLAYYKCPMLCTAVLNGLVQGLHGVPFLPGRDYRVVVVSINPDEGAAEAAAKKETYLRRVGRHPDAVAGWRFLTGREESIRKLAETVGFGYAYDEARGEYAHPAGIALLTPSGKISRYLFGLQFDARDLRLALVESSLGAIGSLADKLLLSCYQYDPKTGRYTSAVTAALRIAGLLTLAVLLGGIGFWLLRERRSRRPSGRAGTAADPDREPEPEPERSARHG